jgi:antagonist of KipI
VSAVIIAAGFQTTVQDLGRPGFASIGVSASGAADPIAVRVANRLVGNTPEAAALEMTLVGASVRFEADTVIALSGAGTDAAVDGVPLPTWHARPMRAGETLVCGPVRDGTRVYLAVRGGIGAGIVLGSASTHLATALGGLEGRALRAGDRLSIGKSIAREPSSRPIVPWDIPGYRREDRFRVTEGPQADWFAPEARTVFHQTSWRVTEACDRMGIRLDGPVLERADARELTTEGVVLGSIQVPRNGLPIVLFVEHQTTGGYPKIATVASVDTARLGQLRPRDPLHFEPVSFDEAVSLMRAQHDAIVALLA